MKYVFDYFYLVLEYAPYVLGASLLFVLLFFFANVHNVYASLNRRTARCARKLKKSSSKGRESFSPVPIEYAEQFENYKKSVDDLPSDFLRFPAKNQPVFLVFINAVLLVALFLVAIGCLILQDHAFYVFAFAGVILLFLLSAIALSFVKKIQRSKAQRVFFNFTKLLDLYFGKDFFLASALPDMVKNAKIDDTIAKAEFLARHGMDINIAARLSRLLNDEELQKPKTVEQQKRLNQALNRLVQNLSEKDEHAV